MRLVFLSFGKFKSKDCKALAHSYFQMASRYADLNWVELDGSDPSAAVKKWLAQRSAKSGPRYFLCLLDERGKSFDSRAFAAQLQKIKDGSYTECIVAVSGPHGFDEELKKSAQILWSLSPMTFAHELACVVASEQLYRGLTILAGHPYHND